MPSWLLVMGRSTGYGVVASATRVAPPAGYAEVESTEARVQALARDSYTWDKLWVRVSANATTAASTIRSRINGADGNQVVSIGAGLTGAFEDAVNSDALTTGNLFNTSLVAGAGGTLTVSVVAYRLSTASNTTPILVAERRTGIGASATNYVNLMGFHKALGVTTEANAQYTFRAASTLSNMWVYASTNTKEDATTFRTRINGANGAQSVSITALTTGGFEDAVNPDSVVAGDEVCYQIVTGAGAGSIETSLTSIKSNSVGRQVAVARASNDTSLAFGVTRYLTPEGDSQEFATTELDTQTDARMSFTAKNMLVHIASNSVDGATTFTLRKNTAASALTVPVAASTTGFFEDTTNTVDFVAGDLLNWQVVTGGTAGTMMINAIGFELAQPTATAAFPGGSQMAMAIIGGI